MKKNNMKTNLKKMVAEHKRLVKVLKTGKGMGEEAETQKKELNELKRKIDESTETD